MTGGRARDAELERAQQHHGCAHCGGAHLSHYCEHPNNPGMGSDTARPCTRCDSPSHSFLECRKDPPPANLAPILERIALELEISNNVNYANRSQRNEDDIGREDDWTLVQTSIAKRRP